MQIYYLPTQTNDVYIKLSEVACFKHSWVMSERRLREGKNKE